MTKDEALEYLYSVQREIWKGDPEWESLISDSTIPGLVRAINHVASRDMNMAKQLERTLKNVLPPEAIRWTRITEVTGAEGERARVHLLPENQHIKDDVAAARKALDLPRGHVNIPDWTSQWANQAPELDERGREYLGWPDREEAVHRQSAQVNDAASWVWIELHRGMQRDVDFASLRLPQDMIASAIKSRTIGDTWDHAPSWLKKARSIADAKLSPLDICVTSLLERHRLPDHLGVPITYFLVNGNIDHLRNRSHIGVHLNEREDDEFAIDVRISGIDISTRQPDWNKLWDLEIRPALDRIKSRRALLTTRPHRFSMKRLSEALPAYFEMVKEGISFAEASRRANPRSPDSLRPVLSFLRRALDPDYEDKSKE